ncbi:bifunctional 5,10-methylenetetrahydrofolate dehydrogenase/5,10-methenyltetrahydrofolate cyclohydrolase [uncultured Helcococcus sp.]|uniref:bifunctional 5,10-methylenetetrahydrofolate dehydrogenase/5,10-methenyltetrahydrofolate cyclohydrolase n=1 Tax=uncultured Helcococcus sp. TaxID=1072508 RepID=UPI00288AAFDB|nr:bifunctional 5,10-methylenetetrahydrofolate dehydrogenase/5,10-methenyltetrahydrofolate cyclohydrolase [uncultured Helcococcus sp.]
MIIDIKDYYDKLIKKLNKDISSLGFTPKLSTIRVGEDPAAISYEKSILREAKKLNIGVKNKVFEKNTTKKEIEKYLAQENKSDANGILIFSPMQVDFDQKIIFNKIDADKDVDGLSLKNFNKIFSDQDYINLPTTATAALNFLRDNFDLASKNILLINRSLIIGKPLAMMLLNEDATVTIAHSKTSDVKNMMKDFDIIISAIGKARYFQNVELKNDALVVDLGISQKDDKYYGDFCRKDFIDSSIKYLPAIGGIGRLNACFILRNTYMNGVKNDK